MKKLTLILLILFSLISCKKKETKNTDNNNTQNPPIKYSFVEGKHFEGTFYYKNLSEYGSISYISPSKYSIGNNLITLIQNNDTLFKPTSTTYTLSTIECPAGCMDKGIVTPDSIVLSLLYTSKSHLKIEYPTKQGYKTITLQRTN